MLSLLFHICDCDPQVSLGAQGRLHYSTQTFILWVTHQLSIFIGRQDASSYLTAPLISLHLLSHCTSFLTAPFVSLHILSHCSSYLTAPLISLLLLSYCSSYLTALLISLLLVPHCSSHFTAPLISLLLSFHCSYLSHCSSYFTAPLISLLFLFHCSSYLTAPLISLLLVSHCSSYLTDPLTATAPSSHRVFSTTSQWTVDTLICASPPFPLRATPQRHMRHPSSPPHPLQSSTLNFKMFQSLFFSTSTYSVIHTVTSPNLFIHYL